MAVDGMQPPESIGIRASSRSPRVMWRVEGARGRARDAYFFAGATPAMRLSSASACAT